jgi:hypothetical protein
MIGQFVEKYSFIQFSSKFCEGGVERICTYILGGHIKAYRSVQRGGQGSENCPKKRTHYVRES